MCFELSCVHMIIGTIDDVIAIRQILLSLWATSFGHRAPLRQRVPACPRRFLLLLGTATQTVPFISHRSTYQTPPQILSEIIALTLSMYDAHPPQPSCSSFTSSILSFIRTFSPISNCKSYTKQIVQNLLERLCGTTFTQTERDQINPLALVCSTSPANNCTILECFIPIESESLSNHCLQIYDFFLAFSLSKLPSIARGFP